MKDYRVIKEVCARSIDLDKARKRAGSAPVITIPASWIIDGAVRRTDIEDLVYQVDGHPNYFGERENSGKNFFSWVCQHPKRKKDDIWSFLGLSSPEMMTYLYHYAVITGAEIDFEPAVNEFKLLLKERAWLTGYELDALWVTDYLKLPHVLWYKTPREENADIVVQGLRAGGKAIYFTTNRPYLSEHEIDHKEIIISASQIGKSDRGIKNYLMNHGCIALLRDSRLAKSFRDAYKSELAPGEKIYLSENVKHADNEILQMTSE